MNALIERPIDIIGELGKFLGNRRQMTTLQRLRRRYEVMRSKKADDLDALYWLAAIAHRLEQVDDANKLLKLAFAKDGCYSRSSAAGRKCLPGYQKAY